MKTKTILYALCLGILVGLTLFSQPKITGKAIVDQQINCYVENNKCNCNQEWCECGDEIIPKKYCAQNLNTYIGEN